MIGGVRGEGEFTREDSVLVIDHPGPVAVAMLIRRDGKRVKLKCPGGTDDPALKALLAGWTYPAALKVKASESVRG